MKIARRHLAVIAAVVVLGALAWAWVLFSRRSERPGSAPAASEMASEGPYRLELGLVGGQPLSSGTPIFFDASIELQPSSAESSPHGEVPGASADALSRDSCREALPRDGWTRLRLELDQPDRPSVPSIARARDVRQDCALYAQIAATPDHRLPAGVHSVRAVWESNGFEVRSAAVPLQISPPGGDLVAEAVHTARYQLSFETPETALRTLDESLPAASGRAEIHSLRGRALEALGRLEEARDAYRVALQLTPDPAEGDQLYEPPRLYIQQLMKIEARLASEDGSP
jgi:hypothetical protein